MLTVIKMCYDPQHHIAVTGQADEQNKKKILRIGKKLIEIHMFEVLGFENEKSSCPNTFGRWVYLQSQCT